MRITLRVGRNVDVCSMMVSVLINLTSNAVFRVSQRMNIVVLRVVMARNDWRENTRQILLMKFPKI